MTSDKSSVRFPWVALALSFLSSGVGHLYCGRIVKGLFLYSARFLLPLMCVIAAFVQPSTAVLLGMILVPAAVTVAVFVYSPIDAYAIARREPSDYKLKEYNRSSVYWLLVVMQLAYPVVLTWGVHEYIYEAFMIPTRSMSPSVLAGDRLLVNKRPFRDGFPERGDVVAFRTPQSKSGRKWIQRVIGIAGDEVVIRGREIEVNGRKFEREQVPAESLDLIRDQVKGRVFYEEQAGRRYRVLFADEPSEETNIKQFRVTVPERSIFVLGDNRDRSRDSRSNGSIHLSDVIGRVDYNFFPAETWGRFGVYRD